MRRELPLATTIGAGGVILFAARLFGIAIGVALAIAVVVVTVSAVSAIGTIAVTPGRLAAMAARKLAAAETRPLLG